MADSSAPTEATANLHLDEVTGERISKSELKKRQKQREKEKAKAQREAAAPPKPVAVKKSNAEAEEKELNPNVIRISQNLPTIGIVLIRTCSNTSKFGHAISISSSRPRSRSHFPTSFSSISISETL